MPKSVTSALDPGRYIAAELGLEPAQAWILGKEYAESLEPTRRIVPESQADENLDTVLPGTSMARILAQSFEIDLQRIVIAALQLRGSG